MGVNDIKQATINTTVTLPSPEPIPPDHPPPTDLNGDLGMPFKITLSQDPFDNLITHSIPISGSHPTLGLIMTQCLI